MNWQKLDWDSEFFGLHIGKVTVETLDDEGARRLVEHARKEGVDCLYFLADAASPETWAAACRHGFVPVDVRVAFERKSGPVAVSGVRSSRPADREALVKMNDGLFSGTRFYNDPHFDRASCDLLYQSWFSKAKTILVLDDLSGYVTCELRDGVGAIGLIGVSAGHRGKGKAGPLVDAALDWFHKNDIARVEVITQGNNLAAQRLYQRHGFVTRSVKLWLHWWRNSRSA